MSANDIANIEQILKNLLLPDNVIRKQAEEQLSSMMQNKESLSICLSQLLIFSQNVAVQTYCAIILRKIYLVRDSEISNESWQKNSAESKAMIKNNLLNALNATNNSQLRKKISNAIVHVFSSLTENEEKWEELLRFVVSGFSLELTEANLSNIEICLYLLSNIYCMAHDELKDGIDLYVKSFRLYFASSSLSLKAKTVECVNELLSGSYSKKESKQFKDLIFFILETTLQCFTANDSENLTICLESLNDLSNIEPKLLRKSFGDIFILVGKITESKAIDDNLREIAFEFLIAVIEAMPNTIKKNTEKITILIQSLFKYAMEMENTIDEEWCRPSAENFIDDEFIPEHKLDEAISLIKRLLDSLDSKVVLEIISKNIIELLQHSEADWRFKYIAYITIAEIMGEIKELNEIKDMIELIFNDIHNPNVKIQYACLYCIAEISEEHNPDFQNGYHAKVIPQLLSILEQSKVLRVQLEVCDALDLFLEHCTDEDTKLYIQKSLDILFNVFLRPDLECPCSLKEAVITVINDFKEASEDNFKPYAERCFTILLEYLSKILKDNTNKSLIGTLFESLATIGPLCPELLNKYLITFVETIIQLQMNLHSFKENIGNYLMSTWEKIFPLIIESHKELIPKIIESLIVLLKKPPEMSIASQPNVTFNIAEFFKDEEAEREEAKKNEKVKEKANLATSETEEYTTFIEILNLMIEMIPEAFSNHVDLIHSQAITLLSYPSEEIQEEISNTFSYLILALSKTNNQALLHEKSKIFISELVNQIEKESAFGVVVSFLNNVKDIIDTTKMFLTTPEINQLCNRLIGVFDSIEKHRLNLLKQKDETTKQLNEDKQRGDNKIYSDDEDDNVSDEDEINEIKDQIENVEEVQTSFSEFFGCVFETHQQLTLEIVDKLIKEYLPKYFAPNASTFEKKLGLLIIDDMAEFLGQDLISSIWTDIAKILLTYIDHQDNDLKNAAAYGIGMFSKFTTKDFNTYSNDLLEGLVRGIKACDSGKKEEKEDMHFAKDNMVSALGKMIKHQGQMIDAKTWVDYWINQMPIKKDAEEGKLMNSFLMEILQNNPSLVVGENNKNLPQILTVLSHAYNTSFCTDECDIQIVDFIKKMKAVPEMQPIMANVLNVTKKGKKQNKMKSLFEK